MKRDLGKFLAKSGQCLAIVLILAFAIWRVSLEFRIKSRLKAIAASGEPTTVAELKRSYSAPLEQNAALLWLEGLDQLVPEFRPGYEPWSRLHLPERNAHAPDDLLPAARGFLQSNQLALATFHRAASAEKSRFDFDLTSDPWAPPLGRLRSAAKLLQLQAFAASEILNTEAAVSSILTILSAARTLHDSPTHTALITRSAIDYIAFKSAERLLNCTALNDAQLQELSGAFARSEHPDSLWRALVTERVVILSRLNDAQKAFAEMELSEEDSEFDNTLASSLAEILGMFARDLPFAADSFGTLLPLSRLPDPDRFLARTAWDHVEQRAKRRYHFFACLCLQGLSRSVHGDCIHRARARIAQTVFAIERFRLAHDGQLPSNFDSAMDPFDGQALRFRSTPQGYVVYSIGSDGIDQGAGARPRPKRDEPAAVDITFFVERP